MTEKDGTRCAICDEVMNKYDDRYECTNCGNTVHIGGNRMSEEQPYKVKYADGKPVLESGHYCYYIPEMPESSDKGEYRPSIVVENEAGHFPLDFTWGKDKEIAKQCEREKNKELGLAEWQVALIILSSMGKGM